MKKKKYESIPDKNGILRKWMEKPSPIFINIETESTDTETG
jgi:hypothetical protein